MHLYDNFTPRFGAFFSYNSIIAQLSRLYSRFFVQNLAFPAANSRVLAKLKALAFPIIRHITPLFQILYDFLLSHFHKKSPHIFYKISTKKIRKQVVSYKCTKGGFRQPALPRRTQSGGCASNAVCAQWQAILKKRLTLRALARILKPNHERICFHGRHGQTVCIRLLRLFLLPGEWPCSSWRLEAVIYAV